LAPGPSAPILPPAGTAAPGHVMTLCFSCHQYAEFVMNQTIVTWLGRHRLATVSISSRNAGAGCSSPFTGSVPLWSEAALRVQRSGWEEQP